MPMRILDKFTNVFVETGTFYGDGIQVAINAGYKQIISIEIFKKYFDIGVERFKYQSNVKIVMGDSGLILGDVIKDINEPITFWLDGHCSGEGTGLGVAEYPILEELSHIKKHQLKNHVIMIDDIRLWKEYDNKLNLKGITDTILEINPSYSFYTMDGHHENNVFQDDILIAKID